MPQIIAEVRRRLSEPPATASGSTAAPPSVHTEEEDDEFLPSLAELIIARREGGEDALNSRLVGLTQRGLARIVNRYGLSPGVKVTRWSKERLLKLIEEEVTRRAFRNDVFLKG